MTKITTDAQAHDVLLWLLWHHQGGRSEIGQPIRKLLGMTQFERMTDEQVVSAKRIADRLASTSPAPDGFGAFVRFGWVCEGDLIFDQAEADEARDSGGDVTTLYTAAPQPVVEKDNG